MYTQFEEKGKIFTPVVTKKPVRVTIQTSIHLIHGNLHIRPDQRLKDALVTEENFLAMTEAEVYDLSHRLLYSTRFIAINQQQIIWILPDEELLGSDKPIGTGTEE